MATSKHPLTFDIRLKRFLYTSLEEPKYITGHPEQHQAYTPEKVKVIHEILQSANPELLLNIIEIVNSENLVPRRDTIFFALAVAAATTTSDTFKHTICTTLLNIIKTTEDLCSFLKFYTKSNKKKFGSAINKVISSYYLKKDPLALALEVTTTNGYNAWTHKDLIKLSHCRSESVLTTIVLTYVLYGLNRAKAVAEENALATDIIKHFTYVDEIKRCEDEKRVIELISELHCGITRVPSHYHRTQAIWEAVLPYIPIKKLIADLPRLYKLGFLKGNSSFQNKVLECLTNPEKIQASQIHPVEVFIGLRNFEKGGKQIDPKLVDYLTAMAEQNKEDENVKPPEHSREAPKCPNIVSALHKALQISFQNSQATGRKIMITIDVSDKMQGPCLNNKNLSCLDAAAIVTLGLLRVERDVTVAAFNENRISIINFERNVTFNQTISKLKQAKRGDYTLPSAPFEWALNKKKQVDVFIHFLYYYHWFLLIPKEIREKEKPIAALNKYRTKMCLPHTKLIAFSLSAPQLSLSDGSLNILDICGLTKEVPKVIEAFSKGLFY